MSNRLEVLRTEYPGDDAWNKFVSNFPELDDILIAQISINPDFIRVLFWKMGNNQERLKNWLGKPVPALDYKTPMDVLNISGGEIIFRSVLMRMP